MGRVAIGFSAPDFSLQSSDGSVISPLDFRGKWTVLYFYPKDDTPGCTKEACGFRDVYAEYGKRRVLIYGVSADDEASHKKFIEKYTLPFVLLSDPTHEMLENYGVWQEKSMAGKTHMGTIRTTIIVDPDGRIAKVFEDVKPDEHAQEVLKYLDVVMANWSL